MQQPPHSAQSQLTGALRPLWGGPTLLSSRRSAIVQNGIGPRKLGAFENCYEFCKNSSEVIKHVRKLKCGKPYLETPLWTAVAPGGGTGQASGPKHPSAVTWEGTQLFQKRRQATGSPQSPSAYFFWCPCLWVPHKALPILPNAPIILLKATLSFC